MSESVSHFSLVPWDGCYLRAASRLWTVSSLHGETTEKYHKKKTKQKKSHKKQKKSLFIVSYFACLFAFSFTGNLLPGSSVV